VRRAGFSPAVRHTLPIALLALTVLSLTRPAQADLAADADELARRWAASGKETTRLPPVFLEHGRSQPVHLPESAFDAKGATCTTLAFLTGRSTDFVVKIDPIISPKHHLSGGRFERSIAGAVLLTECGPGRAALARLSVELRVARSALETVIAVGNGPAPLIAEALPERASGPVAAPADPGPRSQLEPLASRARHAEERVRNMGANGVRVETFTADPDGSGHETLRLDEGCHRLELFADLLGKHPIDLDAELRESSSERLVARDRSDAPDVRLDLCTGATMGTDLLFAGAPGAVHVLLMDAVFPLPKGVPTMWGTRARAGIAAALWRRRLPAIEADPVEQRLGVAGVTTVPIAIQPGSCYVATVSTMRGDPRSVALSAKVDTRVAFDANAGLIDSAAVAFCSGGAEKARLEVEVRGSAVAWLLDIWQMGYRPFDEGQ
jgi:hypothetical protein